MSVPQFKVLTEEEAAGRRKARLRKGRALGSRWDAVLEAALQSPVEIVPNGVTSQGLRASLGQVGKRRGLRVSVNETSEGTFIVRATAVTP